MTEHIVRDEALFLVCYPELEQIVRQEKYGYYYEYTSPMLYIGNYQREFSPSFTPAAMPLHQQQLLQCNTTDGRTVPKFRVIPAKLVSATPKKRYRRFYCRSPSPYSLFSATGLLFITGALPFSDVARFLR